MAPQREWFDTDYYETLGLVATASSKDITRAYRKLAKRYHPDKNEGDGASSERFKEISGAYDVLGDPDKRSEYDSVREVVRSGVGPVFDARTANASSERAWASDGRNDGFGGLRFEFGGGGSVDDLGGFEDLLGGLFGRNREREPQRGADFSGDVTLSFEQAVFGTTTSLSFTVEEPCTGCRGVGGDGAQRCETCSGVGATTRRRDVSVRVPAGVEDGQSIKVSGRGGASPDGGVAGDLLLRVAVLAHEQFGRRGNDLTVTVPISFVEAALGGELRVPTMSAGGGGTVRVRVPAGTQPGGRVRVRGRGVQTTSGVGDLLVSFKLVVPTELTQDQRQAVEALAATLGDDVRGERRADEPVAA